MQRTARAEDWYSASVTLCMHGRGATVEFFKNFKRKLSQNQSMGQVKCSDRVDFDPGDQIERETDQRTNKNGDLNDLIL